MTGPSLGLLDTSVLVASETGRRLQRLALPQASAVSVVTVAEIQIGVLVARDSDTRLRRMATLDAIADMEVLPIDERVSLEWARLRVHLSEHGRRLNVNDLWIAATAAARGIPVVTQDADFDALEGARGVEIIRV